MVYVVPLCTLTDFLIYTYIDHQHSFPPERLFEFFNRMIENSCFACVQSYLAARTSLANPTQDNHYEVYFKDCMTYAANRAPYIVFDDIVGLERTMVGCFPHLTDNIADIVNHQVFQFSLFH